jgi:chromosome segregation ATPase
MTDDALKNKIKELRLELEKKDQEIEHLDDIIEELQDKIMELEDLKKLDDGATKKSKKIQAAESRFAYELEEKDRQIRDLKNNMGFLRKEKVQFQQELERMKSEIDSSVIRVEDLRSKPPLNALVKDLQETVNKQRSVINRLSSNNASSEEFGEKLVQKEEEIEILKTEISELNQKMKDLSSPSGKSSGSIAKNLIEDLQKQLTKAKRQIVELKQKFGKSDKKGKKQEKDGLSIDVLEKEINELKNSLQGKENQIEVLKKDIIALQKAEIAEKFEQNGVPSEDMIKALKEDLQKKLNRSKLQIKSLQEQLDKSKMGKPTEVGGSQKEIEGKLKMQREMAIFLQKQLETKEGEIETIKNEAVQIKMRYRQLENQLKLKNQKLSEIQRQLDSFNIQTQVQPKKEDPDLALRVRELKNRVDNLNKLNSEQRLEISQLRKKT